MVESESIACSVLAKMPTTFSTEFVYHNRPILHPSFSNHPNVVLKPVSDAFPKLHFILLYKETFAQFYAPIADFLATTFDGSTTSLL